MCECVCFGSALIGLGTINCDIMMYRGRLEIYQFDVRTNNYMA